MEEFTRRGDHTAAAVRPPRNVPLHLAERQPLERRRVERNPLESSARAGAAESPRAAPACRDAPAPRRARSAGASSTMRPRYITATRSQICRTSRRSCAMKRYVSPSRCCRSSSRLTTCACTETSSADTGSSADDERRLERERAREADALPLAAAELVRVLRRRRRVEADELEQLPHARAPLGARADAVNDERLLDDRADAHARIERRVRILEDDLKMPPRAPQLARRQRAHVECP